MLNFVDNNRRIWYFLTRTEILNRELVLIIIENNKICQLIKSTQQFQMKIRRAFKTDLPQIIALLADDKLGSKRERYEDPLPDLYYKAFEQIESDTNQELVVIEATNQKVIGTLQLSFIPYLTYQGGIRSQIEAVRISKDHRGKGLGEKLFVWAINRAKERGAHLVQLTTDKKRPDALRFYEKLGFVASHEGMKYHVKN